MAKAKAETKAEMAETAEARSEKLGDAVVLANYVELRSNAENEYYHHFLYDADLEIGQLVVLKNTTGPAMVTATGATILNSLGICMQRKVNAWNNRNGDDLVDVRVLCGGAIRTVGTMTAPAAGVTVGVPFQNTTTGAYFIPLRTATSGNSFEYLGP